jgi:hypothetical protein
MPGHKRNIGGTPVRKLVRGKAHVQHLGGSWEICPCGPDTFDHDDLAEWNSRAGSRWNRFWNNGVKRDDRFAWLRGAYLKAAEGQRRGALHFHVLIRVRPDLEITSTMLAELSHLAVSFGFGHVLDVEPVEGHRAAGYVAKYVSKGANDRPDVPWSKLHPTFGRLRSRPTYRTWTASRDWPHTMKRLRTDRRHYAELCKLLPRWEGREVVDPGPAWFAPLPTRWDWQPPPGQSVDMSTGELISV